MRSLLSNTSRLALGAGVAIVAAALMPAAVNAQSMAGKTITLIHNASPGGSTGLGAQVAADAWAKAIEGNPTFVVQSVAGGALTKGINSVMNARPNGTTLGWLAWQGSTRILDVPELQVAFDEFGVIGGVGGANFFVAASKDTGDGISSETDIVDVDKVTFGGFSVKSGASQQTAAAFDMLDVDWKFASGFRGGGPLLAALGRGEIDAYPATATSYGKDYKDGLIADGDAFALWHYGPIDADGNMVADPAFGGVVPTFVEFYEAQTGNKPEGNEWDVIKFHSEVSNPVNWLVVAPPGTSDEMLAMFRESFAKAVASEDFQEAALKVFGSPPNILLADEAVALVSNVKNTSEEMKTLLKEYIERMEQ